MSGITYVTIPQFSEASGYTKDAVRSKIRDGVWLQDVVWIKAPDGRVLIDIEGYHAWAEHRQASDPLRGRVPHRGK